MENTLCLDGQGEYFDATWVCQQEEVAQLLESTQHPRPIPLPSLHRGPPLDPRLLLPRGQLLAHSLAPVTLVLSTYGI